MSPETALTGSVARGRVPSTRVPRPTYASMVTEGLRDSILSGAIAPGSQLSEVKLASTFGVSRGPVREALQRLIQEGLVRSAPHRGVIVPVLSGEDVRDIYLARVALESAAVKHIIATADVARVADDLERLVKQMAEAEAAGNCEKVASFDLEFHTALVAASGSERLQRMFNTVISETRLSLGVLPEAHVRRDLVEQHRQLAELIRERETTRALAVLKTYFDDSIETLSDRARTARRNHD
jgi:DNA-binding GntR family transcriptional regulator